MGVELLKGMPVVYAFKRGDLRVPWIVSMGWFLRFSWVSLIVHGVECVGRQ